MEQPKKVDHFQDSPDQVEQRMKLDRSAFFPNVPLANDDIVCVILQNLDVKDLGRICLKCEDVNLGAALIRSKRKSTETISWKQFFRELRNFLDKPKELLQQELQEGLEVLHSALTRDKQYVSYAIVAWLIPVLTKLREISKKEAKEGDDSLFEPGLAMIRKFPKERILAFTFGNMEDNKWQGKYSSNMSILHALGKQYKLFKQYLTYLVTIFGSLRAEDASPPNFRTQAYDELSECLGIIKPEITAVVAQLTPDEKKANEGLLRTLKQMFSLANEPIDELSQMVFTETIPTVLNIPKFVYLKSLVDGGLVKVETSIMKQSVYVDTILTTMHQSDEDVEAMSIDDTVPTPVPVTVSHKILLKIVEYCDFHASKGLTADTVNEFDNRFLSVDQATLFELIMGANSLQIKSLLDSSCQKVANMIKGKTPEEIRKTFNIKNDFTPEEEEQVRRENEWAEETPSAPTFSAPPVFSVDEEKLAQLMSMGFSQSQSQRALTSCKNNVDRAVDMLTATPAPPVPTSTNTSYTEVPQSLIDQIVDMGFSAEQAKNALQMTGNDLEGAVEYLANFT